MKTQQVKLTAEEIEEQKGYVEKYADLIQKELSYDDLADWDSIYRYWESYQHAKGLVDDPVIEMPVFN